MSNKTLLSQTLRAAACATLAAAAALIFAAPAAAQPSDLGYSYPVKYICGPQRDDEGWAVTGEYRTEINIYNHNLNYEIHVEKKVIQLVKEGKPVGREPEVAEPSAFDRITLKPMQGTMDDCERIAQLIGAPWPMGRLFIGYLDVVSPVPITVKAIYTARNDQGMSIDVEDVEGKERL